MEPLSFDPITLAAKCQDRNWPSYDYIRRGQRHVVVHECGSNHCEVSGGVSAIGAQMLEAPPSGRVLAWRTWDGAWHVLDSRVSAVLPQIDSLVEGD